VRLRKEARDCAIASLWAMRDKAILVVAKEDIMRATIAVCLVVWAVLSPPMPANAEVTPILSLGGWEVFAGRSDDGRPLCGMSTQGGGRWLGIKHFKGDSTVVVQLSEATWRVADNVQVAVLMQFDNDSPWRATAASFHSSNGDGVLQFPIYRQQFVQWIEEFKKSDILYVRFPNEENIEDWQADLSSTAQIADAWALCLVAMYAS
jgi:hypothetical protein